MGQGDDPRIRVMGSVIWRWSRFDGLANHHLEQILQRGGFLDGDITDPEAVNRAVRVAVENPATVAELDDWAQRAANRCAGAPTSDLRLEDSIGYLTERLDAVPLTPEMIDECLRKVAAVDDQIVGAKDLPELAHPDATTTALLWRYVEARGRVLAASL
ncbi:hypothetical protein [Rhodococcus koreensis]|uniref:Uncharacterized protein n=1 Tax=Rhodococcus koreensis TaxID=99653 RepID=A0A1H4L8R1_9NOCA|nr:hypothetical protein [Rhodococcus koreensis]SEB66725.1 hypothetical protein SAMN04490239_1133 [Rhodococcus koreensis]